MNNNEDKILLILDVDETLIHASTEPINPINIDFSFDEYNIYKRPYLSDFLNSVQNDFKIAIWSSAGDEYVNNIVANVFPADYRLEFIWGRSKCTLRRDFDMDTFYFSKPLKKLKTKGYSLEKILIIDDSPEKSNDNYGNAIYIKEFKGEPDDELKRLSEYLQKIKEVPNVRNIEKRGWRQ